MANNQGWYSSSNQHIYNGYDDRQRQYDPRAQPVNAAAADTVQNGQRLLAMYPPASATPTHHVSQHISSITLTNAPAFPQNDYYNSTHHSTQSQGNQMHYSEYDQQLRYLATANHQQDNSGFWENTRNDAVRMLNEQAGPSLHYQQPTHWNQQTSFQPSHFSQSVFQRTTPSAAYPTPPPVNHASSSLAGALGPNPVWTQPSRVQTPPTVVQPPRAQTQHSAGQPHRAQTQHATAQSSRMQMQPAAVQPQQRQASKVYMPHESQAFYEDFLERKARQMMPARQAPPVAAPAPARTAAPAPASARTTALAPAPAPVRAPAPPHAQVAKPLAHTMTPPQPKFEPVAASSPDPLAMCLDPPKPKPTVNATPAPPVTPHKRKAVVMMESPSIKRIQLLKASASSSSTHQAPPPTPPHAVTPRQAQVAPPTPSSGASDVFTTPGTLSEVTPTHKRVVHKAYVSVPRSPWLTPSSTRKPTQNGGMNGDTPDLGGYGSEEDGPASPTKRYMTDSVKTSARRTGDRDDRGPLEKFTSLVEDIFEAEDSLPPDAEASDLNHEFFSSYSQDFSRPALSTAVIRKLTKYIGHVARPTKRLRQVSGGALGTPRGKGRMADVDTQMLSRLMKLLERSVKVGEDLDPLSHYTQPLVASSSTANVNASPTKKAGGKKGAKTKKAERQSRSQTPKGGEGDVNGEAEGGDAAAGAASDADFEKLAIGLDTAHESILAADCCIALLGSDRLTKQLYSEELITSCLNAIKNQLTKILYPFVEASAETGSTLNTNPLLHGLVKNPDSSHRRQMGELFQALCAVIPRISNLINTETVAMSDSIIIQGVYISIGPFFVADSGGDGSEKGKNAKDNVVIKTLGKSAMRGLRLEALSLIRSIFANHEDQRSWIIEEILSSLIKLSDTKQKAGQFRLRDGRSIRTVSALLLQLVQTSAHDVRIEAQKIHKSRQNKLMLRRQESFNESQPPPPEPFLDENDEAEIRLYSTGLESATKAAKTIIIFLTQRSGKGKATKNSNEAEYRLIFDNLIEDLLVVLFWPEWPAASLILSIATKFMVSSLDDVKTNSQTDSNAAKTMALDHLGVIAARIRTSVLKIQKNPPSGKGIRPLDEIVTKTNLKFLNRFLDAHMDVAGHLSKRASEDQAFDSARELTGVTLGQELAAALKIVTGWIENPESDENAASREEGKVELFGKRMKTALREVWKDPSGDVFDIGSEEDVLRADGLAEEIGTIQSLRNSFNPILSVILMALDAPAIFMRTKALRALGQIVTSDASILAQPNVRRGIESHLLDSSPAVRDAAVELIGKYMIESPDVASDYYQKIADRMADTGLSVRKRVIKLLKSFYPLTDDARKTDIATRMMLRMLDEDDTVKDLAIKTIEELWFPAQPLPSAMKGRSNATSNNTHDKASLLSKVAVIMGTSANFKDRQSPLEDILHKIMADKEGNDKTSLHSRYSEICEALIDGLVDASDLPGFTVTNCIRTIYLLTSAYPSILSGTNASTLLPYLKNASSPEELATSDYLLKIFKVSIPHMPKTSTKFGQELQAALQPMIIKPSSAGGIQILQETVACMCAVVQHLTHDFIRLVNLLKSCNARLQQTIKRPITTEPSANEVRALVILIFIISLLAEHFDFDALRMNKPEIASDLNMVSERSIVEHIFDALIVLYNKYDNASLRGRILQCLGFLFRAQPTLMTMDQSSKIMDDIFSSPEEDGKGRLLKIIQEFLVSEASKHSAKEKESTKAKSKPTDVNMEELVGNTDGFADSGVSSAIVQRYLDHVLEAALCQNLQIQGVAIDVLSFTIKQGLAHPLQSFPVIVALETSPITSISNRATALHAVLQGKHSSLLNTRYTVSARKSFDYQKKIATGELRGFQLQPAPVALLQRWYSHVREKRPTRQDFLKSLVRVFQESDSYESSQDDVNYTRYMAENFAAFDYKTQEEVLTIIKYLTGVLSTTGMHLLEIISPNHLLTHLHTPSQSQTLAASQSQTPTLSQSQVLTDTMSGITLSASQTQASDISMESAPDTAPPTAPQHDQVSLMRTSVIIAMVMLLKAHLKSLYSLSEDKCNKFVIGKKSAIGDKPATKRNDSPISWARLPFALTPLHTSEDAEKQKTTFIEIWNEDGLTAEPEEEDFL